jgi:hypothetical protein
MVFSVDTELGTLENFLVLGATPSVTNAGATVLTGGGLGIFPAASVTGFPPGIVTAPFSIHLADAAAQQAQTDAQAAYSYFKGMGPATPILGPGVLDGKTFTAGTYSSATTLNLGVGQTVTLDGGGDSDSVFVFQAGTAINFDVSSVVKLQNGAAARNIVWVAGSGITLGTSAQVNGNLIGNTTVALGTGSTLNGRAVSLTAAVTLLGNTITIPVAAPIVPGINIPGAGAGVVNPAGTSGISAAILSEICHPDITGKTLRSWGLVSFEFGSYTRGGIAMGLMQYLDVRTVDFNGFLKCDVWGEEPVGVPLYEYHYSPVGDVLQIFNANGTELTNGSQVPASVLSDIVLFEVTVDRTSVRG